MLADDSELGRRSGDVEAYFDLAREGEAVETELAREIESLSTFVEAMETRTMLSSETDPLNAILTVHPGAGGNRVPGLGRHALAHVPALGRAPGL